MQLIGLKVVTARGCSKVPVTIQSRGNKREMDGHTHTCTDDLLVRNKVLEIVRSIFFHPGGRYRIRLSTVIRYLKDKSCES